MLTLSVHFFLKIILVTFYISYFFLHISFGIILEKDKLEVWGKKGHNSWFKGHYQPKFDSLRFSYSFSSSSLFNAKNVIMDPAAVSTRHRKKRERQRLLSFPTQLKNGNTF